MGLEHKISGVLQLTAVLVVSLHLLTKLTPTTYAAVAAAYFVLKGVALAFMKKNPLSFLDAVMGTYLLFAVFGWVNIAVLNVIAVLFLVQKGVTYLFR